MFAKGYIKSNINLSTLIIIGFSFLVSGCNGEAEKETVVKEPVIRPVKTITVKATDDTIKKTYSTSVLATSQVDLSFRVSGKLKELPIRNGLKVKKGDVIAKLDERDFKAKISQIQSQINQASAQMKALKAGARSEDIASLTASARAAQAKFNQAKKQYYRTQGLVKKQVIARQELEKDRSALEVAKANLASANQELRKGKAGGRKEDVSAQVAAIQGLSAQRKSLKDALSDATLRAPFDGIISSRKVENFANVQANAAIATIQRETSEIDFVFNLPAPDIAVLGPLIDKLNLVIILDSYPDREFPAQRKEFSSEPDVATQTYEGVVTIQAPANTPILPGMSGNLFVSVTGNKSNNFAVPLTALASNPAGKSFVWVVSAENKVSKRDVTIGEASGSNVSVLKGINEGDVIVTAGVTALQDEMVVKPITAVGE